MAHVVQHQGALHRLMDALALLDLLAGFAKFVASSPGTYTRPGLSDTGVFNFSHNMIVLHAERVRFILA